MSAAPTSAAFRANSRDALADANLQAALRDSRGGFVAKRAKARAALPEFDALRDEAAAIKDHALAHLDHYLEAFEAQVVASGGQVHWAETAADARAAVSVPPAAVRPLPLGEDEAGRLLAPQGA